MSFGPDTYKGNEKIKRAVEFYRWHSAIDNFQWTNEERLETVWKYLSHLDKLCYWDIILEGGVRGYSLFLHEWTELLSYKLKGLDPFDLTQQQRGYREMHARGLLVEHRFLQSVAQAMGSSFSLCELVTYNPHGDEPEGEWPGDWQVLIRHLPHELSFADHLNLSHKDEVLKFYRELGFRKVESYA